VTKARGFAPIKKESRKREGKLKTCLLKSRGGRKKRIRLTENRRENAKMD